MAKVAVTCLLDKVTRVLIYYAELAASAKSELEQLRIELGQLRDEVKMTDLRSDDIVLPLPAEFEQRGIRRVVYEVEDILDFCLTQEFTERNKRSFIRRIPAVKPVSLAEKINRAREEQVRPLLKTVRFRRDSSGAKQLRDKVKKVRSIREANIVGFKEDEKILIDCLMKEKRGLDIISIFGQAGLGKTTLAKKIFQNKMIQLEFSTRIWVSVPQKLNLKEVLLKIMKKFTHHDMSGLSSHDLIRAVYACLEKGKYLLVMDNVWEEKFWDAIKCILPKNNSMAKVVITSRTLRVGISLNHELHFRSAHESWELFRCDVFEGINECPDPSELESIRKWIVDLCCGLPLALKLMAGIFQDYYNVEDLDKTSNAWKSICYNFEGMLIKPSLLEDTVLRMLELSYDDLPHEQRECFLYISVFPECYEIPTRTLIHLWIAEGFIQQKEKQSLEETAEETLRNLINRNLLMIGKTNHTGQVKTCLVHDVIRNFFKENCLWLFGRREMYSESVSFLPFSSKDRFRLWAIHSKLCKFFSMKFMEPQHARSFLCFNDEQIFLPKKYITTIPDNFNLLRVLESKSFKFPYFPLKVTNLIHLTYMTLSCHDLTSLPEEMSNLWNLQTFLVMTDSPTLEMKANIWKMFELRHLKSNAAIILSVVRSEGGQATGENLQTLSRLSPQHCTQDVLDKTRNLNMLGIRGDISFLLNVEISLKKLIHLEKLKLENDQSHSASEMPRDLPKLEFFPPNIKKLTLYATKLSWEHMSTLAKINTLTVLKLQNNAFIGKSWRAEGEGFCCLEILLIECTDLVFWEVSTDHFPLLKCLVLRKCEKLTEIPFNLVIGRLRKLDIDEVPKSAFKEIEDMKQQPNSRLGGLELHVGLKCK